MRASKALVATVFTTVLSLVALPAVAVPRTAIERLPIPAPPDVSAPSWVLYDDSMDVTLAARDADSERPMASTTKIMSALVAFERLTPGQLVTISARADAIGEAEVGLVEGEQVDADLLVRGLLIRSGNDAAVAVAESVAGSVEGFVELMNEKAAELGLDHTQFANPHGLDQSGHFSSAADLVTLSREAMKNESFAEAVATRRLRLPDSPEGNLRIAETTNRLLLDYAGAIGVKTGFTFQAGLVLVAAAERDGRRLYAVVMGSEGEGAHFRDARALLDHGFETLRIVPTVLDGASYAAPTAEEDAQLAAQAAFESLLHVFATATASTAVEAPVVDEVSSMVLNPPELPSLGDAFRWFIGAVR